MRLCKSVPLRPAVARIKIHVKTRTGWRLGTLVLCLFLADALRLSPDLAACCSGHGGSINGRLLVISGYPLHITEIPRLIQ